MELKPTITKYQWKENDDLFYQFIIPKIYMKSISLKNFRLQYSDFEYFLNQLPIYYDAKYLIFKQMQKMFSIKKIEFVIGGVIFLEFKSKIIEYILSTENEVNLTQQWISALPNQNGIYHDIEVNIYYNNNYYRNKPILVCNEIDENRKPLNQNKIYFSIPYIHPGEEWLILKKQCEYFLNNNLISKKTYDKYLEKDNYPFTINVSLLRIRYDMFGFF